MDSEKTYKPGIYISPEIMEIDINPLAKILYGTLTGFKSFKVEGVWATRKTLAKITNSKPQRITEMLKVLMDAQLIFFNGYKTIPSTNQHIRLIKQTEGLINSISPPNDIHYPYLLSSNIYTSQSKNCEGEIKKPSNNGKFRPCYFRFAQQIQSKQMKAFPPWYKQYSPSQLQSQIDNSAKTIDQLVRLDNFEFETQIKPVIEWGIQDPFWTDQIRSIVPLRNKSSSNGNTKFANIWSAWCKARNINPKKGRTAKNSDFTYTNSSGQPCDVNGNRI